MSAALVEALVSAANYIDLLGGDSGRYRQVIADHEAQQSEPVVLVSDVVKLRRLFATGKLTPDNDDGWSAALEAYALPAPADKDVGRLDYLQERGATVFIRLDGNAPLFEIGGIRSTLNRDIRTAIDTAIAAVTKEGESCPPCNNDCSQGRDCPNG